MRPFSFPIPTLMHQKNYFAEDAVQGQTSQRLPYESPRLQFIHFAQPLSLLEPTSTPTTFEEVEEGGDVNSPNFGLDQ